MTRIFRLVALTALTFTVFALFPILTPRAAPIALAGSNTIEVYPGNQAIRKALRQANPGDVLNLHAGTYPERVNIKKANLTLQAAGDGTVLISASCDVEAAVAMNADNITIVGISVQGGEEYAISQVNQNGGEVRGSTVISNCLGAEYGINVFNGGSFKVIGNTGSGWDDAAIYIGGISATPAGALVVKKNKVSSSTRGIIIEDSTNVAIKVITNKVHDNTDTGILIHNSDGVLIRNNTVTNNVTNGIYLDAPSDNNLVRQNTISGHTFDIRNDGTNNCFSGNTYTTSSGPVPSC